MKAIIFAAGMASRLGNLTKNLPKACLKLNDSETILDRALSLLSTNNFTEVLIVKGHAGEAIDEHAKRWAKKFTKLETFFNPEYSNKNNIYTAYLVKEKLGDGVFVFNSDIVYDSRILELATKAYQNNPQESFMVVDNSKTLVDEDMKISYQGSKIIRINKALDNHSSEGEYIGIMHISNNDLGKFSQSLEFMIVNQEFNKYYEDALDRIASDLELRLVSTQGHEWTEIDTLEDYNRARNLECAKSPYLNNSR